MVTLITNTTSVIELAAHPFTTMVPRRGLNVDVLAIPCSSSMSLESIKEAFNDEASTVSMIIMENNTEIARYTDYIKMEEVSWIPEDIDDDGNTVPGYYVVKMAQKLTFEKELLTMKKTMGEFRKTVEMAAKEKEIQDAAIENVKTSVNNTNKDIQDIQKSLAGVNPDTLTLPELKEYLIKQSKENLAAYLATHPVSSTAHKGILNEYSITSEKQSYLMAMILMTTNMEEARLSEMKKFYENQYDGKDSISFEDFVTGVDNGTISTMGVTFNKYQPSWNAVGNPCTYDWTLAELKRLAAEIEATVRPLVSRQQAMEIEIKAATSIEDAKKVNLSFGSTFPIP